MDDDVLRLGHQIFPCLAGLRCDDHPSLALQLLAKGYAAVNLGNNRLLLELAHLKQLRNSGQTAGDVLGFGGLTRNFSHHCTGGDLCSLICRDDRANRQRVAGIMLQAGQLHGAAPFIFDRDTRSRMLGNHRMDDDTGNLAGDLVNTLLHGVTLDDIAVFDLAAHLGNNWNRERIPVSDDCARINLGTVHDPQLRAVRNWKALAVHALLVHNDHLSISVHNHVEPSGIGDKM